MPNALRAELFPPEVTQEHKVIATGDNLTLAEWLDVSWFYPEDFSPEKIHETQKSYIVEGQRKVLKFFKESPENQWTMFCHEIVDNSSLAPNLYLGVMPLCWVDGEPSWGQLIPLGHMIVDRPPKCDDLALVMRRIPKEKMLQDVLEVNKVYHLAELMP